MVTAPISPPPSDRVLIVGGGLAGLAAATGLAAQGVPVTLLESRDRLGGRASSFVDPESGETLDNCQHVSMGCCTNLQHFCQTIGVADKFRVEDRLAFIDPEGRTSDLSASPLPAPLHLLPSFAGLKYLTWGEKGRLALGLRALARCKPTDASQSFLDWLRAHGQSDRTIERFWEVVLVSALSESLDRIDISHARKVFVDAFLRHRDSWRVHVPTVPLDELYGPPVIEWLRQHGSDVRTLTAVRRLHGDLRRIEAIELRSGERLRVDDVILAVPHHRVLDLLPNDVAAHPSLAAIARIESAPITSLHLWFDRPITELQHAVCIGRLTQWVFARRGAAPHWALVNGHWSLAIDASSAPNPSPMTNDKSPMTNPRLHDSQSPTPFFACQVVISASRSLKGRSQESIRDQVLEELRSIWPAAREAQLLHWRMISDQRAVFSVTPGIDALRPVQQSPVPNLQFAGDWTATGWPATMEGAVRSGYLAAENILRSRGLLSDLLQPDLPTAWLSRIALDV